MIAAGVQQEVGAGLRYNSPVKSTLSRLEEEAEAVPIRHAAQRALLAAAAEGV